MSDRFASADEALDYLYAAGYYSVEIETSPDHVSAYVWRRYQRLHGFTARGGTLVAALTELAEISDQREL